MGVFNKRVNSRAGQIDGAPPREINPASLRPKSKGEGRREQEEVGGAQLFSFLCKKGRTDFKDRAGPSGII